MTNHGDEVYIDHINKAIEKILAWAPTRDAFFNDERTREAVLRKLQTMAESVQKVSGALKAQYPEVPWRDVASIRNVLVHDYIGLNLERIWDIVENGLPSLIEPLSRMYAALTNKNAG